MDLKNISFEIHKETCIDYLQSTIKCMDEQILNKNEQILNQNEQIVKKDEQIDKQEKKIIALASELKGYKSRKPQTINNINNIQNNYYDVKNIATIAMDHLTPIDYDKIVADYSESIFANGSEATKIYIQQKITYDNVICLDMDRKIFATVDDCNEYIKTKLFGSTLELLGKLAVPIQGYMNDIQKDENYMKIKRLYTSSGKCTPQEQLVYDVTINDYKIKYAHAVVDGISDLTNFTKAISYLKRKQTIEL